MQMDDEQMDLQLQLQLSNFNVALLTWYDVATDKEH